MRSCEEKMSQTKEPFSIPNLYRMLFFLILFFIGSCHGFAPRKEPSPRLYRLMGISNTQKRGIACAIASLGLSSPCRGTGLTERVAVLEKTMFTKMDAAVMRREMKEDGIVLRKMMADRDDKIRKEMGEENATIRMMVSEENAKI